MPRTHPRLTIVPVRHYASRNLYAASTFERASHYEVRQGTATGKLLARFTTLQDARAYAELRDRSRNRSRESILGCRWSEVAEEVSARTPRVLYTTRKQEPQP